MNRGRLFLFVAAFGDFQRSTRFFFCERCVTTSGTVGAFRKISLCTVEEGFRRPQIFGCVIFSARFLGGSDCLSCVAHLLDRCCGTTGIKQRKKRNDDAAP